MNVKGYCKMLTDPSTMIGRTKQTANDMPSQEPTT